MRSFCLSLHPPVSLGGIAVPLCNTHPAAELEYHIQDSQAAVVVVCLPFAHIS